MKNLIASIVCLFSIGSLSAQNLVLNPSFESVNSSLLCSWYTSTAQFNSAINNWTLPTGGTTDIFNTSVATSCYAHPFSTNAASGGPQAPRTGNGFCNLSVKGNGGCSPWREYLQGELSTPLIVGQTYEVEMFVSLLEDMSIGVQNIGVLFGTAPMSQAGACPPIYTTPDLVYTGPVIIDKVNWTQIIFCYTPTQAGLQNFIIGNFHTDGATITAPAVGGITSGNNVIRYYIDDVRIEQVSFSGNAGTNGTATFCATDPSSNLFSFLGGSPSTGGTWSGPTILTGGDLGTYNPAVNTPGVYTYTVPGGGCAVGGSSTATVTVSTGSGNATITPAGPLCVNDPTLNLVGADLGGTWTGTGITNPVTGAFNPLIAGVGTHTITYTITGVCGDTQTTSITVTGITSATITSAGPFCQSNPSVQLIGANAGGTWSGSGITNASTGTFDPAVAGVGTHTVTYSIPGACGDTQTTTIQINPTDNATITPVGPFCANDPTLNLVGADPGGSWTGTGITNSITGAFDPSTAGAGAHTITYSIPGVCGDIQTAVINVIGNLSAAITSAGPFCQSDPSIQLIGADAGGTWSGIGITNASTGTFDPAIAGIGTHTITYSISSACGDTQTTTIQVNSSSDASITPAGPFCANDPIVNLVGADPGGTWTGTGITNSVTGVFDPSIAGIGAHTITYSIPGVCGDLQTVQLNVLANANATITSTGPFCQLASSVQLIGTDPGGTWSGNGITNPALGTFDPNTAGIGTHTITYTITGLCGDTQTTTIQINATDDASITPAGPFCIGNGIATLQAITPGGTWSGVGITDPLLGSFDPLLAGSGTHSISYTTSGSCSSTGAINIVVLSPLSIIALQDQTICEGETADLTANASGADGVYSYSWADQVGASVGTGPLITVSPIITTTYTVIASSGCPAQATSDILITVLPIPTVTVDPDELTGCAPLEVTFSNGSGQSGTSCLWDFGNLQSSVNCGPVTALFADVGCYDITLTVSNAACSNTVSITDLICVIDGPVADFIVSPDVAPIESPVFEFTNHSINADSYSWDFGDGTTSLIENPVHTYSNLESYTICLTTFVSNCSDEICQTVTVDEGLIYYIPNTFTPDGDAYNQTFKPIFTLGFDPFDFKMLIFNRWGEIIWETNDASIGWDGTYGNSSSLVQDGTYTWAIEYKVLKNDERVKVNGHVNLIR